MRGILRSRYGLFQVSSQISVPHFTCSLETNHKSFRSLSFLSLSLSLSHTNQELEYSTCQTPRLWTCSGRASKDASDRGV